METGFIKIIYDEGNTPSIEAELVNNTVWLTTVDLSHLLNCYIQEISVNLRSIFKKHLLWEEDVSCIYRYTDKGIEKQIVYYNLEVLIFLAYRIDTFEAQIFRQFINAALREHLKKDKRQSTKLIWLFRPEQNYLQN